MNTIVSASGTVHALDRGMVKSKDGNFWHASVCGNLLQNPEEECGLAEKTPYQLICWQCFQRPTPTLNVQELSTW